MTDLKPLTELAGQSAANWPGWRGPGGFGVAPKGDPPLVFGPDSGYRWKKVVPGNGNSSPVVWNDFVLLTTALESTEPAKLSIHCYRRTDGALLWQKEVGKAIGRTHAKNGYASASVVTDGQRIFAFFGSAGLFCVDFSGELLWHADLGDLDHIWGTAASPVLFENLVIQACDSAEGSYIGAFDQATGKPVWRTDRASTGCWSTPAFVEIDRDSVRRVEMVVNGTAADEEEGRLVIAYDPNTGDERWRVRGTSEFVTPIPVIAGGLVYCMSGRNGPIMAIRPGGEGDVTDSHVVWKHYRGGPYIPSGIVYRNRLFIVGDAGRVTCYDAGNGTEAWSERLRGPFTSSLVAANGRIHAVNEHGLVEIFKAGDTFERLATNNLQERCLATPAIVDGDLLVRTETTLYCFSDNLERKSAGPVVAAPETVQPPTDNWPLFRGTPGGTAVASGRLPEKLDTLWTFTADDGFYSTAVVFDDTVYIGCLDGNLYAIELSGGKRKWEFTTDLGFEASPAVYEDPNSKRRFVLAGDADGVFYCLDATTGKPLWDFQTEAIINSSANFHGVHVLFGSQDGILYCLDIVTGNVVWKYESDDMIQCSPSVADGHAFIGGCDGRLHVVDLASGTRVRDVDIEAPTLCTPALHGSMAYVGTTGQEIFAVDWKKGEIRWRYENAERPAEFRSSAAVTPDAIIVGGQDKLVHAIDRHTGNQLWTFATKRHVDSSPIVIGNRVFAGSGDGRLYELDLKTGELRWQFEAGGSIVASPSIAKGRLFIGTDEGDLYCFGDKE